MVNGSVVSIDIRERVFKVHLVVEDSDMIESRKLVIHTINAMIKGFCQ